MEVLQTNQAFAMLYSLMLGFFIGNIYHLHAYAGKILGKTTKIFCRSVNKKSVGAVIIKSLWDFLFFVIIIPLCAIAAYGINLGIIRWYLVLAAIVGLFIYSLTCKRIFNFIFKKISILLLGFKKRFIKIIEERCD